MWYVSTKIVINFRWGKIYVNVIFGRIFKITVSIFCIYLSLFLFEIWMPLIVIFSLPDNLDMAHKNRGVRNLNVADFFIEPKRGLVNYESDNEIIFGAPNATSTIKYQHT